MEADGEYDDLSQPQAVKLHGVGQALRATFDADNHATLSKDVMGLMLDLSKVPFEPHEFEPIIAPPPQASPRRGWLARARLAWNRSHR